MSAWMRIIIAVTYLTALLSFPAVPAIVSAETIPTVVANDYSGAFSCSAVSEIPLEECIALVSFFRQTGGYGWLRNDNWLESTLPSEWYGVLVRNGHVVGLHLKDNGLSGLIPADLDRLTALHLMELDGNDLQGELSARLQYMGEMKPSALPSTPPQEYPGYEQNPFSQLSPEFAAPQPVVKHQPASTIQLPYVILDDSGMVVTEREVTLDYSKTPRLDAEEARQRTAEQSKTFDCATVSEITLAECQALVALYNSTNGAGWYTNTNWLLNTTPSNWYGITVNSGHVQDVWIDYNNLVGTIPSELGNLLWMWNFNLVGNQLTGSIPASLGSLGGALTFHISYNQLSGSIPSTLGNLHALYISLNSNQLSGIVPAELGNLVNVNTLRLGNNLLSGTIPTSIGNVTTLQVLTFNNNQLSGVVPNSITNLINLCVPSSCGYYGLDLGYNQLTTIGLPQTLIDFLLIKDPDWADTQWTPFTSCDAVTQIPVAECNALVALYNATSGTNWTDHTNWLESGTISSWYGVTVSGGHVTQLYLPWNDLNGQLPAELGNLTNLTYLYLSSNQLTGVIPASLGSLSNLQYLELGWNELSGPLPPELANLTQIISFQFYSNQLSGPIPAWLGNLTSLESLNLGWNNLSGPLPVELGNLINLRDLNFERCQLSGAIPTWIGSLTNLEYLSLGSNQFTGIIPAWLGSLTNLRDLYLGYNDFIGSIPVELGNLTNLYYLNLAANQLTGTIPATIGNLTSLISLNLSYNQLSGSITPELGNLPSLEYLTLNNNLLTGSLPSQMSSLTSLQEMSLEDNQISGNLPTWLGNLTNLEQVFFGHNQFSGSIPAEIGNLTSLLRLSLPNNLLTGAVPTSFTNLINLCLPGSNWPCWDQYGLDLGYNYLTTPATPQALVDFLAVHDPDWADTQIGPFTSCAEVTAIPITECNALVDLYNATDGPNWDSHNNWLENNQPGMWYGVTVFNGHVIELDLGYNSLSGALPDSLGTLTSLSWLNLSSNQLSGILPAWLGSLTNLQYLILSSSQLTGPIPTVLGNLTQLYYLSLSGNPINGPIPPELGNLINLEYLYLYSDQLTGSIPTELGNLTNLRYLNLSTNQLSGDVPASFTNLVNLCIPGMLNCSSTNYGLNLSYNYLTTPASTQALADFLAIKDPDWAITQIAPFTSCTTITAIPVTECDALTALYNSTGGPNWQYDDNWFQNNQPGTWFGVYVDNGHVTGLQLGGNNLTGMIPTSIGSLPALQWLDLYSNQLFGSIPSIIGNLINLQQLDLSNNQLTGSIPTTFGNLVNLYYLYLNSNQLSGSIPSQLGNLVNLESLYVYNNLLSGSLPSELGNLANLRFAYFFWNQISGSIPASFSSLTNLIYLDFFGNQLSGSMPDSLGNLVNLRGLDFSYNQMTGSIPASLGNLNLLIQLRIGSNQFTGMIPSELGNLVNLCTPDMIDCYDEYGLDLGFNQLTTPATPQALADFLAIKDPDWQETQWIPFTSCSAVTQIPVAECQALVALYNATGGTNWINDEYWLNSGKPAMWYGVTVTGGHVTELNLYSNHLGGSLPAELANLPSLEVFEFSDNQLTGMVPTWIGSMNNMVSVGLGMNHFTGSIPSDLGNLANLQLLHLGFNQLSGTIPAQLGNLSTLYYLSLSSNQLTGIIPAGLGSLNNLSYLFLDNNLFTGSIPSELGNLTNLRRLYLNDNQLSGNVPTTFTNLVNLFDPTIRIGLDLNYNRLTTPATPQDLADFLTLKNPGWELTQAVSDTIDTSGGEITSNDGDTNLILPTGSAPTGTVVTFVPQPGPSSEIGTLGFGNSAFLVEVTFGKFDFALPVTVSLTYADADLGTPPWLLAENGLKLYWWNGTGWVDAVTTCTTPSGYIRDASANTLQLSICKSGEFALLGVYQPMLFLPVVRR